MPLDELVYLRLDLPKDVLLPVVKEAVQGRCTQVPHDIPEWEYRTNLVVLMYEVTARTQAHVMEGDLAYMTQDNPLHLSGFLQYHLHEGWFGTDSTVAWKMQDVGEFVGLMRKCDQSAQDFHSIDEHGNAVYRQGIVFLQDTSDHPETFRRIFRRFISRFSEAWSHLSREHGFSYARVDLPAYRR